MPFSRHQGNKDLPTPCCQDRKSSLRKAVYLFAMSVARIRSNQGSPRWRAPAGLVLAALAGALGRDEAKASSWGADAVPGICSKASDVILAGRGKVTGL